MKGNYKQGDLDGISKEWFKDGQLKYAWNYKQGEKHGSSKKFTQSGDLMTEAIFKDGEITFQKIYLPGGSKSFSSSYLEMNYKNGEKIIEKTYYDYKIHSERHYSNGKVVSEKFHN